MRAVLLSFALGLLLTAPLLSGCLAPDDDPAEALGHVPLAVDQIVIPDGARLIEESGRVILRWANVDLPFSEDITLPKGATIVRAHGELAGDLFVRSSMKHSETDRRRCNPDVVETAWNLPVVGHHTCSGMTAVDRPGENWTVSVTGAAAVADLVEVIFESGAPDGLVASLDLSRLSMRDFGLEDTTYGYVESFDGTKLWTEVTLPKGEGPWPTIIAASPYNGMTGRLGQTPEAEPAMWGYWSQDWAERGYAVVNVDVRGFGLSEGCVEVWSENEQKDQRFIVDWVAEQDWSDGGIGFYGQSYVATTPLAAASLGAEALDAVIMVAPVVNAYEDWHYGGVPNGENAGSPAAYQVLTDAPPTPPIPPGPDDLTSLDPVAIAKYSVLGVCDATLPIEANDPRAVYDAFYEERDFKKMVKNIKAASLFTEGFEDSNVKSQMIPDWFNEIDAPKLGLFGHWVHQHPTRADEEVLFLGWMDHYVKGRDLGFEALPNVEVVNNLDQTRQADVWPDDALEQRILYPNLGGGTFSEEPAGEPARLVLSPAAETTPLTSQVDAAQSLRSSHTVTEPFAFSGIAKLNVRGNLENGGNAYLAATLYDVHDGKADLVTYGMVNLAHNEDNTRYMPVSPIDGGPFTIGFLPTEYVFQEGHQLVIELRGVQALVDGLTLPGNPGSFLVDVVDEPTDLVLPLVPLDQYDAAAATATR